MKRITTHRVIQSEAKSLSTIRKVLPIVLLVLLPGCKSHQSASRSQTRMTGSSQVSALNKSLKADTASTYTVTQSNGYIFIKETQVITEYDTTQPTHPVSKKTETKKNTLQGVQSNHHQEQSEGKRTESESTQNKHHTSDIKHHTSEESASTPVVQTTAKWYITGGILVAILTIISTWLAKRRHKKTTSD